MIIIISLPSFLLSLSPQGFLLQFEKLIKMAPSFPEPIKTIVIDLIKTIITELKVDFSEKLIMTRTVEEILWGYQDPFLKFVADLLANVTFIDLSGVLPPNGVFQLEVSPLDDNLQIHVFKLKCTLSSPH